MPKKSILGVFVGRSLPPALRDIEWVGSSQQHGSDSAGNEWIRDDPSTIWTHVWSEFRFCVDLAVMLYLDGDKISDVIINADFLSHGRPASLTATPRERRQVAEFLEGLFGDDD